MKVCCKNSTLSLVMLIMIELMVTPWPVFSGGPDPQGLHPASGKPVGKVSEGFVPCPEPRPQMCSMDYRPVCAQLADGRFKTYSNGCTSCTDSQVLGYRDGACEEEK